ncbi:TMV resistance protein N-like [Ziziphus jujuba]|uniref:ADP-ribosyl cyclase/cyclic ADP-ribose hydrolase n=1 Tax=Ziziphus jujuba TaxID=326968 RepID=A0A6P4A5K9_ZIZJJ|nr:TMV resistance protein N-like [Ziziphus jujuba]
MASSSLSFQEKYDVFLSFRGEDTRNTFASHLYAALLAKQILTFMDHKLERGDKISPTLIKTIEESKISVIIFSENYPSSKWCLEELVQILECKKTRGQIVIPIFYCVDPSVVRNQTASYGVSFTELEKRFREKMETVNQWRTALTEASNLSGWDSKDVRPDSKLVRKIVKDISNKLFKYPSSNMHMNGHLIGIEKKIKEIESILCIGTEDVRIIGIWGMAGIGKTTLASAVFQRFSYFQFESSCFLRNVREEYLKHGPDYMRKKLLFDLLRDKSILSMDTPFVASPSIHSNLCRKKVLIVLDDVDSLDQFEAIVTPYDHFAPGSRIIVTTKNKQVLEIKDVDDIYKLAGLNHMESLELFNFYAFGKSSPSEDYEKLVSHVICYAHGNPLALRVLGSSLRSKSTDVWESALSKLKTIPHKDILNVLRISYEGLDKGEQNLFLDIACLIDQPFTKDDVEHMLDAGGSFVKIELTVLIDKSLIESHEYNMLWMHDLLRQVGQTIVRDEHREPGKRSRLWDVTDVCRVLERNTGTAAVEGISFNVSEIHNDIKLCHATFSEMYNLRLLKIYRDNFGNNKFKLHPPQGLGFYLSDKLTYLRWDLYPLKSLSSNFSTENLVELVLRGSHVQKLWNNHEVKSLPILRRIDLSYSKSLTQLPDLSQAPNLESINLEGCTSLVHVLSSLQNLEKLTYLNLNGCSKLRDFEEMSKRSEGYLDVGSRIQNSTDNLCLYSTQDHISQKFAPNLTYLLLRETTIGTVPPSICRLSGLVKLDLSYCTGLESLPTGICHLKSLESLDLCGCEKLKTFPEIVEPMEHLRYLSLASSGIEELPESIENLVSLKDLSLESCKDLEFLPNSLCDLRNLGMIRLSFCSKIQKLPSLPPSLELLLVTNCKRLKSLPELPSLCLSLSASGCTSLENVSGWRAPLLHHVDEFIGDYSYNDYIDFCGCEKLDQDTDNTMIADRAIIQILARIKFQKSVDYYSFIYPGDEIPNWFNHQTCGTSINNIMLPPYWNNDDFLGLAFCIVFHWNIIGDDKELYIGYKLNFKTIDDGNLYKYCYSTLGEIYDDFISDHVVIWHAERESLESSGLDCPSTCSTEASFHVYPSYRLFENVNNNGSEYGVWFVEHAEIKKFGVRFVYKQDMERCDAETERKNKRSFNECCESSASEAVVSLEEEDDDEYYSSCDCLEDAEQLEVEERKKKNNSVLQL